jgi:hypothetical protein
MKTIAQELNLYEAIHDELGIEVPEKQLAVMSLVELFIRKATKMCLYLLSKTRKN